jgi:ABC-2 type transport system permease protein
MNTESNRLPQSYLQPQVAAPAEIAVLQRFYWSVRREGWENRSIYLAPMIAAALFLFGFLVSLVRLPAKMRAASGLDQAQQHKIIDTPYEIAAAVIMGTAFIVGVFYCLDALYGERRDRSILFWKSLPVSDLTTVLAKLSVAVLFIPLLSFAISVVTQWVMLLLSSVVLLGSGLSAAPVWTHSSFVNVSLMMLYHLVTVHGLWYTPLYGWLLLMSAWAPRAPFVAAFLPPFVVWGVEKIAFNTSHFLNLLKYRLAGPEPSSPTPPHATFMDILAAITPAQFFSRPGLWIGLAITAAFVAGAVRLRRSQGPI